MAPRRRLRVAPLHPRSFSRCARKRWRDGCCSPQEGPWSDQSQSLGTGFKLSRAAPPHAVLRGGASLAVAGFTPVYDTNEINSRLADEGLPRNEALRAVYGKMKRAGELRYIVKPGALSSLDPLYESCPNFKPVIDDIKKQLALA